MTRPSTTAAAPATLDAVCVEITDMPGRHNYWCPTARQARAMAMDHVRGLGPGWTVDHDARPRPHFHVVQLARGPGGRVQHRRVSGHFFYGERRPYRIRHRDRSGGLQGELRAGPGAAPRRSVAVLAPSRARPLDPRLRAALDEGRWQQAIARAMALGMRDENTLTDLVFHAAQPGWVRIRDTLVRPALRASAVPRTAPAGSRAGGQLAESAWAQEVGALSSDEVRWIQRRLNDVMGSGLAVDGVYGRLTRAAVMAFQRRAGLAVDGIVGPVTTAALRRTSGRRPYRPGPPSAPPSGPSRGVGTFDGKKVASWLIPYLTWARQNGWQGTVTSGYRSPEESERICFEQCGAPTCGDPTPCAGRGSNHSGDVKPRGAIDVSDHTRFRELMARAPFSPRIRNSMPDNDPEHFSESGY